MTGREKLCLQMRNKRGQGQTGETYCCHFRRGLAVYGYKGSVVLEIYQTRFRHRRGYMANTLQLCVVERRARFYRQAAFPLAVLVAVFLDRT